MERREKKGSAETLRGEQEEEEKKDILSGSVGAETQGLQAFNDEDEEEQVSTGLIRACQKGITQIGACYNA